MFAFLGTIGHAIESGAEWVGDTVQGAVHTAVTDPSLGALVNSTVDNIRHDLAVGISQAGAGMTNAVTHAVAPSSSPLTVPITRNALYLAAAGVVLVVVLVVLLWRK
jgi:hypothetical protein